MIALDLTRVKLASGIELDTVDVGPRDADVLIFLHGFPENHRTWRHQIRQFSDRYRCIAPDQRGYRGSSRPQAVDDYSPDKLIGDIFQLADALGVDRFTICGHDWGGAIAWGTALFGQANGRVRRCVIANAPHHAVFQKLLYTNQAQRAASQYMRAFRDPARDAITREQGLLPILFDQVRWDRPQAMDEGERAVLLEDWKDGEAAIAMLNWYRASPIDIPPADAPLALPEGWQPPQLPSLTIPTLVVWGMEDEALPPENLTELDQFVEDLTLVKVPGSGHFVPWEAPDAVNAAMEQFLAR